MKIKQLGLGAILLQSAQFLGIIYKKRSIKVSFQHLLKIKNK